MNRVTIFDTSICTENVGDEIIMDCVNSQLMDMFKRTMFLRVPTHEKITKISYMRMKKTKLGFVGGTNLLASNMRYPINQWNIHIWNTKHLNDVILMGVGSQNYGDKINLYTKYLYRKALSSNYATAKSQVEHKVNGYITELSIDGIVNGIETLYRDIELRKILIKNCNSRSFENNDELYKLYKVI